MPPMRDVAAAALLLLFGVAALVMGRGLPFGTIAAPGPGFFPLVVAAALAGMAGLLLLRAVAAAPAPAFPPAPPGARIRLVAVMAALFGFAAVLDWLGFMTATFLLMVVLFRVVERHRWAIVVAESAAAALACHVLFKT